MTLALTSLANGTKIHGVYMGFPFSGVVTGIESDASGYADMRNAMRLSIKVDAAIGSNLTKEDGSPWNRRDAGEEIICHIRSVGGGKVAREDDRYERIAIRRAA